jgi:hypothetical protein
MTPVAIETAFTHLAGRGLTRPVRRKRYPTHPATDMAATSGIRGW